MLISNILTQRVRQDVLEMIFNAKASHIGSAFSIADIVSVLYADVMKYDKNNYKREDRDVFILSKGHAGSAVYAVLYELGILTKDEINSYCKNGSNLSGHVSSKGVEGVEFSTGSLGHGISVACGMAFARKRDAKKGNVYVLVGDGECNEGSVWEAAMFANQHGLDNLCVIVDCNKMQAMGNSKDIIDLPEISKIWSAFGWNTVEINGHDCEQIYKALTMPHKGKPLCVIANTIKGKGVSFMEGNILWHYRNPDGEAYNKAKKELTD